jgi:hypothetical protein
VEGLPGDETNNISNESPAEGQAFQEMPLKNYDQLVKDNGQEGQSLYVSRY